MNQEGDNSGLLSSLKLLYHQLSERILKTRIQGYQPHRATGDGYDTLAPLSNLIEQLSQNASPSRETFTPPKPESRSPSPKAEQLVSEEIFKGLSNHFRRKSSNTSMQPHLANKLCDATRSHISLALRHARMGDKEGAHMQVQLANNALQMAASYMSEEEYRQFRSELQGWVKGVEGEISEVKG